MAKTATADAGVKPDESISTSEANSAASTNATMPQMTTVGGERVEAEGQQKRDLLSNADKPLVKNLSDATVVGGVKYDETGRLTDDDGTPLAATADAYDASVGWTAQHGSTANGEDVVPFPIEAGFGVPDQTYSEDELPDPLVALRNGLLPQNVEGLRIDPDKHSKKKSLEA